MREETLQICTEFTQPWLWNCSSKKSLVYLDPGCCCPARPLAGIRDGGLGPSPLVPPRSHPSAGTGSWCGPVAGPAARGHFLRVCCLRACSRWRAPVLDPAPMEKAAVEEPGGIKVAQVTAASLGAGAGALQSPSCPRATGGLASPTAWLTEHGLVLPLSPA